MKKRFSKIILIQLFLICVAKTKNTNGEIVITDDGRKDNTGNIADDFERQDKHIRVIHHPTNLNLGNALKTGFKNSKGV